MTNSISSISSSSSRPCPADMKQKLESLGVPDNIISQGPDAVKAYASQNGITLPEPPQKPNDDNTSIFSNSSTDQSSESSGSKGIESELLSLGVPSSVISQGRDAVMKYMRENNITPPAPPEESSDSSGSLNITA